MSGLVASAGAEAIGEDYIDGDGIRYLPLRVRAAGTEALDLVGLGARAGRIVKSIADLLPELDG
jgi:hypothetical protein